MTESKDAVNVLHISVSCAAGKVKGKGKGKRVVFVVLGNIVLCHMKMIAELGLDVYSF